ncbi:putative Telomere recombination putative GTP binding controlling metal binding [Trypanosoma vivax]|nr:putative Telomere recombination putative GTP binding controlling metal binding [Trypanosoma vivax]
MFSCNHGYHIICASDFLIDVCSFAKSQVQAARVLLTMARVKTASDLGDAVVALCRGDLVALPTETVYGLGANALDEKAVQKIFTVKGRPTTDPLICHVPNVERAFALWDTSSDPAVLDLIKCIGDALWPGPLTVVYRASNSLPSAVTGGSGFVGVRVPAHPVALQLLQRVDFPVAAPSANTFGHVSPTTTEHVLNDLGERDPSLLIVDGGRCDVGIESTVIKVADANTIEVLRRGKVSVTDVERALGGRFTCRISVRDTRTCCLTATTSMDGPGQLLTHYSPNVVSRLLTPRSFQQGTSGDSWSGAFVELTSTPSEMKGVSLKLAVVIDFGGILQCLRGSCLAYLDLSAQSNVEEACFAVFEALRWSETVPEVQLVLFPLISEWSHGCADLELLVAVEDRLFRAASGEVANVHCD